MTFSNENKLHELLRISDDLNHIKDIDSLLDTILYETRRLTNADAGSIFLLENNRLNFSYVQNDTLKKRDILNNKQIYSNFSVPVDDKSIAGYVALKGKSLAIKDVHKIDSSVPYSFNKSFDEIAGYKTASMMTIPLITTRGSVIGVMQIINSMDDEGKVIPFTDADENYINFFAGNATSAIEKAKMTREMILRMIKMAELRDPKETGAHVNRVGAYSIEIFQRWADRQGLSIKDIKNYKDILRIAAMLHDVGKVAISDIILKKPGKLNANEYQVMKTHAYQGAKLFKDNVSDLDALCYEIAYTHHEKWDGSGYPRRLKGEVIPLSGRIVALADVYDALISARVYKPAWREEDVIDLIKKESGSHFDPNIVSIFMDIYDVITAIREKFPDKSVTEL
ncbi:HD domain-containing phosphohydrolase, partial [Desulfamplus magnetovallimortis]|uniref:HD domain-containing phosphohydrolase n=1 Tax=Desulfamplus magnetovallimortis TaxID=1246637 RepID=UPI00111B8AD4